jgi:S1-C subfamily serine protease
VAAPALSARSGTLSRFTMSSLEALSNDLAAAVTRAGVAVVAIHARRRIPSSGVLWRNGLVVAADHTVHKEDDIRVTVGAGDVRATLVGRDPGTDLCVLRLSDDSRAESAALGDAVPRVGQLVLAAGRPGSAITASLGIVSAVGPEWRTWRGGKVDQFVRLDVAVYDGFSGGAIVDATGRVIGIGTSGLARASAIAIPVTTVNRVVDRLLARGARTRPGYLGIGTQPVRIPESARARLAPIGQEVPRVGLLIVTVEPGAPAERSGFLLGDLLVALGDEAVADPRDVFAALDPDSVGQTLRATIVRAGAPVTLDVVVGEHPRRA